MKQLSLLWIGLAACASLAPAQTIIQVTSGIGHQTAYFGQKFTTPSGGPWSNITFNFYATSAIGSTPASTPIAAGTAFLLTQEYLGTPAALSSSTPGFLAQSTGIYGGIYVFPSGIALNPGTNYWLYVNALISISGGSPAGGPVGATYVASTATSNFFAIEGVANFNLGSGALNVAPVPPTLPLTAVALLCVGLYVARRRLRQMAN